MNVQDGNGVWANEIDKDASKIYRKNFGDKELVENDIRKVDTKNIPNIDLLVGGFPCQSFSVAGKRQGLREDRGTLFTHIARIAKFKRPKLLLLENVEGLLSNDCGRTFAVILRVLGSMGYLLEWQVFNGKDYGVPQNRRRIIIIGHLTENGRSAKPILPIKTNENPKTIQRIAVVEGQTPSGISRTGDRLYSINGVSPTLTSQFIECSNPLVFIGEKIRPLTIIEWERLQGFPDNWTEGIHTKQRHKCVGNAVVVPMIEQIGYNLLKVLE